MRRGLILAAALMPLTTAIATEQKHEDHGAHEHGHGTFNVAIEGNTLAMELMAPGADIVGFEHEAKSDADKQAVAKGEETLSDIANVVTLPADAGCTLTSAKVEVHREDEHDDHAQDKKHEEKHEDKEAENHGEFHVEYALNCKSPQKLTGMRFTYFDTFKGAEELDVTVVGPKQQLKFEVNRATPKIALGGIM